MPFGPRDVIAGHMLAALLNLARDRLPCCEAIDVTVEHTEGSGNQDHIVDFLVGCAFPSDPEIYREIGKQTSQLGYIGRDYKKPL
jgi:hypothetical protein